MLSPLLVILLDIRMLEITASKRLRGKYREPYDLHAVNIQGACE